VVRGKRKVCSEIQYKNDSKRDVQTLEFVGFSYKSNIYFKLSQNYTEVIQETKVKNQKISAA
jgi:hypothetical protein